MKYCLLCTLFFWGGIAIAQGPPPNVGQTGGSSTNQQGGQDGGITFDTSAIFYYFPESPEVWVPFADSSLTGFQQYDPARRDWADQYLQLGNLGTAALPVRFALPQMDGFHVGLDAYDLYYRNWDELPFYDSNQAYTHFRYSQGQNVNNAQIEAAFGRKLGDNMRFTLDYRRINNQGVFRHQQAETTTFQAALHYFSPNGRYENFVFYGVNNAEMEEFGGQDLGDVQVLAAPLRVPLFLETRTAATRQVERSFRFRQTYQLGSTERYALAVDHNLNFSPRSYRFSDINGIENATYYGPLLTDPRGLRYFIDHQVVENDFQLAWQPLKQDTVNRQLTVAAGLQHRFHQVDFEPRDSSFNEVLLTGNVELPLQKNLVIRADGTFAVLGNIGNYRLNGVVNWRLPKWGSVEGLFTSQLRDPNLVEQQFFMSQKEVWGLDFSPVLSTVLGGKVTLDRYKLSLDVNSFLLQNYVYWSPEAVPQQADESTAILSAALSHELEWGNFSFDNRIVAQQAPDRVVQPSWFSAHSIYFNSIAFEDNLRYQLGVDARILAPDQLAGYQPGVGQFHTTGAEREAWLLQLDIYASIKVKRTRLFIKWENILPNFVTTYNYQIDRYAQAYGPNTIRWGVSWRFVD